MKFRGKMVEMTAIKKFYTVVGAMAKIAKVCVLRLTQEKFYFILSDAGSTVGRPHVWCEMKQENYFYEYNLQGVSPEQDEIYLEFSPDALIRTLTSLKSATGGAKSLKIKLTKRNESPCLTFEVELQSMAFEGTNSRECVHEISVQVLPRRVWNEYREPSVPRFDVSICLPDLKGLHHLVERFKGLGSVITLTADREGRLVLEVASDEGVFSVHYSNLRVPVGRDSSLLPGQRSQGQARLPSSVRVELRRLAMFLAGDQLLPNTCIANIVDTEMLHMIFKHDDFIVQYFLPATSKV